MSSQRRRDEPLTVLCVDDNALDAELLRRYLQAVPELAFEFHHCETAAQALDWHDARRADLVFLDSDLGDRTALEWLQEMQRQGRQPGRTVLFTGQIDPKAQPALEALGCRTWLDKNDLSPESLARIVQAQD